MKYLKYAFLVLVMSVVIDGLLVFAAMEANVTYVVKSLSGMSQTYTSYITKSNYSAQSYENTDTWTALNNPCSSCAIVVKFEKSTGEYTERTIYLGDTKIANLTSLYVPGQYRLGFRRGDFTLLETWTAGTWDHQ